MSRRARITALIVACAPLMQNLDSTVVATALPAMAHAFPADPVHMSVALTSYMLSLSVFIPASGWVADRFGSRSVFRAAIIVLPPAPFSAAVPGASGSSSHRASCEVSAGR